MKNIPHKIYLNVDIGSENPRDIDFKQLSEVCWSNENIFKDDITYISEQFLIDTFSARINEIDEHVKKYNEQTMSGRAKPLSGAQKNIHRLRGIKKELKEIIQCL